MPTTSETTSFVARLWLESGPNGDPKWRGHIQHVQSGRSGFFDNLCALQNFVERVSGMEGPQLRQHPMRAGRFVHKRLRPCGAAGARPKKKSNA